MEWGECLERSRKTFQFFVYTLLIRLALLAHGLRPGQQREANVLSEQSESKDCFYISIINFYVLSIHST